MFQNLLPFKRNTRFKRNALCWVLNLSYVFDIYYMQICSDPGQARAHCFWPLITNVDGVLFFKLFLGGVDMSLSSLSPPKINHHHAVWPDLFQWVVSDLLFVYFAVFNLLCIIHACVLTHQLKAVKRSLEYVKFINCKFRLDDNVIAHK